MTLNFQFINTQNVTETTEKPKNETSWDCIFTPHSSSNPKNVRCKIDDFQLKWYKVCPGSVTIDSLRSCIAHASLNFSATEEEKRNTVSLWFDNTNIPLIPWSVARDFPNLVEFRIRSAESAHITKPYFEGLRSVKHLSLSNYGSIEAGSFDALTKLEVLDLSSNEFVELPPNLFQKNLKLKKILLNDNKLQHFDVNLLSNLRDLEVIDLSENFDIKISPNAFRFNPKLKEVHLSRIGMNITEENLFEKNVDLEIIDLSHNSLIRIPSKLFQNNLNLTQIDLSGNVISEMNKDVFQNLKNLQKVKLNSNSLTEIGPEYFEGNKKLSYLDIRFNNFTNFDEESFKAALPEVELFGSGIILKCLSLSVILLIAFITFLM